MEQVDDNDSDGVFSGLFTLTVQLGNAAMQTPIELAGVLYSLGRKVEELASLAGLEVRVRDLNGNTVGTALVQEHRS